MRSRCDRGVIIVARGGEDCATRVGEHVGERDEALIGDLVAGEIELLEPHRCLLELNAERDDVLAL